MGERRTQAATGDAGRHRGCREDRRRDRRDVSPFGRKDASEPGKGERVDRKTAKGMLSVHDEVIQTLAEAAALEVAGVTAMAPRGLGDEVGGWIARGRRATGVVVSYGTTASEYVIDLYIIAALHSALREVARGVGQRVGSVLTDAVGIPPALIRVHIEGVEPA